MSCGMARPVRVLVAGGLVILAMALAGNTVAAQELPGFGGAAMRVVATLTEPAALVVWGSTLAGLAHFVGRKRQKS